MPEDEELFAVSKSGIYHRQSCSFAKNATILRKLSEMPENADPCDRCNPPPVPPAQEQQKDETPPPVTPAKERETESAPSGKYVCIVKCFHGGVLYSVGDTANLSGVIPASFRKA